MSRIVSSLVISFISFQTITCDCEATAALQLKASRRKADKLEISHYRVNVNRFRARLNVICITEKLLLDLKCDGWPDVCIIFLRYFFNQWLRDISRYPCTFAFTLGESLAGPSRHDKERSGREPIAGSRNGNRNRRVKGDQCSSEFVPISELSTVMEGTGDHATQLFDAYALRQRGKFIFKRLGYAVPFLHNE